MKHISKLILASVALIGFLATCTKLDPLPVYGNGTAVVLTSSTSTVAPTVADSNKNVVTFSWTSPKYAQDTSLYKYVIEIDSTGRNFSREATKIVTGGLSASLTGRELNAILLNFGFSLGAPYSVDVRVKSSYGNNNEQYLSNIVKLTVTPYSDPSVLTATATSVVCTLANASLNSLTFSWTTAFTGYPGSVNYSLQYDSAGKNFVSPTNIPVGVALFSKAMTQGEMNTTALNSGIAGGTTGKVEYRIKAVTALGAIAYSNVFNVTIQTYIPLLRFYLPGSYQAATGNGNNWDPPTAPEFIRDLRPGLVNNMYYIYIYLPAGTQFKVTQGRSWNINYGGSGGILSSGGANLSVATAGVYRISINQSTLLYDISPGRMGFVGGATGAGWNPPNVFPTYAMGAPATDVFVGITDFTSGGWKLIDNNAWNNGSNSVSETRSYGTPMGSGSAMEVNGNNFNDPASPGRYRVIWDGRDVNNITYLMNSATEMRLVGDGMNQLGVNDWDPPSSPQMTYSGNGVWTITIALKASKDLTFLAGNAWGAFQYQDNSGQSLATGIDRKIKWGGGNNFKTVTTAGTYTVTLNEYTQTMKIN